MFSYKTKLDSNLRYLLTNNCYRNYRVLIKYKNIKTSIIKKITSLKGELLYELEFSSLICAKISKRLLERLLEYPEVEFITLDEYLFLCGMSVSTANNTRISSKCNLSGKGVCIGILDSGVYPHSDLLKPTSKINYFKDLINNLSYPYDDNGHGTCIAGLIASSGEKSKGLYRGIAHHASLYCYKAFDALGKGFASDILFAIEDLINTSSKNNIKILCLPFELLTHNIFITKSFDSTFLNAINKGIIPIVPSGSNLNSSLSITGIATLSSCITVGGLDTSKAIKAYDYSSCGKYKNITKPDLSAAAVNITTLNSDLSYISEKDGVKLYPKKLESYYKSFSGTSLAVGFISAICALLFEKKPDLSFKDIYSLLKLSCECPELDNIGEGYIDISKLPI